MYFYNGKKLKFLDEGCEVIIDSYETCLDLIRYSCNTEFNWFDIDDFKDVRITKKLDYIIEKMFKYIDNEQDKDKLLNYTCEVILDCGRYGREYYDEFTKILTKIGGNFDTNLYYELYTSVTCENLEDYICNNVFDMYKIIFDILGIEIPEIENAVKYNWDSMDKFFDPTNFEQIGVKNIINSIFKYNYKY